MAAGFKKILFPTDFSEVSLSALKRAAWIAARFKAELHIISVVDSSVYVYANYPYTDIGPALLESAEQQIEKLKLPPKARGLTVKRCVLEGDPAAELVSYCSDQSVDLIVMASHARSKVARFFLGSVADKLMHAAPCPMMLIRAPEGTVKHPVRRDKGYKKLLVPVDFSDHSQRGLSRAASLATEFKAELHLLHVIDSSSMLLLDKALRKRTEAELNERAKVELARFADGVSFSGKKVLEVSAGEPAEVIGMYAMKNMMDMVVVGSHGRSEFGRLFLGSVVDSVVRIVECPVFVEHPKRS